MDRGNGNGNTVLLTVIGVATLLVALVGATFAYFTAAVSNDSAQSVSVTTATPVGLVYETQGNITLTNAIPNNNKTSTFTVENPSTSTTPQTYDLDLLIDTNTFNDIDGSEQLMITLSAESTTAGKTTPSSATATENNTPSVVNASIDVTQGKTGEKLDSVTDGNAKAGTKYSVVKTQRIAIGEKQTYTIKVEFKDLGKEQDNNQKQAFGAHVEISNPVSVQ